MFKKHFPLIILAAFAILIRYAYYIHAPGIWVNEDTYGYYYSGADIVNSKIPIGDYRTPVYGLLIQAVMFISGQFNPPMFSPAFYSGAFNMIILQFGLGILSVIILYQTAQLCGLARKLSFFLSLFISADIMLFSFERLLLTESLAAFLLIIYFAVTVNLLRREDWRLFIPLAVISVLNVFNRPVFMLVPLITSIVLSIMFLKKGKFLFLTLASLAIYFLSVISYSYANGRINGYFGVSRISDINLLGVVLKRDISVEKFKKTTQADVYYYEKVKDYRAKKLEKMPFRFLEYYNITDHANRKNLIALKEFTVKTVLSDFNTFFITGMYDIPKALTDTSEKITLNTPNNAVSGFFHVLYRSQRFFQLSFFLVFPFFLLTVYCFIRRKNTANAILLILSSISIYQILASIFLSYGEYGRLITPARPLIYLFLLVMVFRLPVICKK